MAVFAKFAEGEVHNPNHHSEAIIAAAIGLKDQEYGIPLELFELTCQERMSNYCSTQGPFEDTIVDASNETDLKVYHRLPGRLRWFRENRYSRFAVAQVAKTPRNMQALAAQYYDGLWICKDPLINAELKSLADAARATLTPKQMAAEEARIKLLHTSMYGGETVATVGGKSAHEEHLEEREKNIETRERDLARREAGVVEKTKETVAAIEKAPPKRPAYDIEMLKKMQIFKLNKIAREEFGIRSKNGHAMSKDMVLAEIEAILKGKAEAPAEIPVPEAEEVGA